MAEKNRQNNSKAVTDASDLKDVLWKDVDILGLEDGELTDIQKKIEAQAKKASAKKKRKIIFFISMMVLFAAIFLFSGYKVVSIKLAMKKAADNYSQLEQQFHEGTGESGDKEDVPDEKPLSREERFAALKEINPDLAAWISIEDTRINYPVVFCPDQEYYLSYDFYGNYSINGTPFIGSGCDLSSDNIIIYGHCMKDGSMFNNLLNYEDRNFFDGHRSFRIETAGDVFDYDIAAVFLERVHNQGEKNVFRYYEYTGVLSETEYSDYVQIIRSISFYDTGVVPQYGQQLITLSTCHYSDENARLVVVGVRR